MIEYTKENYIKQISQFHPNIWSHMQKDGKQDLLQWIVDYKAKSLGFPSICTVEIGNTGNKLSGGKFNSKTLTLVVEEEVAVNGLRVPYRTGNEESRKHVNYPPLK